MSHHEHTPKQFVLQLGSLISLYIVVSFLLVLVFGVINTVLPSASVSYYRINDYSSQIRIGIAMLVVFYPAYLLLTRTVNAVRRQEADGAYLLLAKWFIYLSLFIAGGALLIDLVIVLLAFLEGEITARFIGKVLAVFVVVGAAFYYYLLDARGYWLSHRSQARVYALGASMAVVSAIIVGFLHIETPAEVRERSIDERQIEDLTSIQWSIERYLLDTGELPETIADIPEIIPTAPEERESYFYAPTEDGFELCATFAYPSYERVRPIAPRTSINPRELLIDAYDWYHEAGRFCFDRTINRTALDSSE